MPADRPTGNATLIVPDLHHHLDNARFWIERIPARRVVFLGDYFDDFRDRPEDAARMAAWLRESVESRPDWIFLVGNHDLPYLYPLDERLMGPGFHLSKREEIGAVIRGLDRSRLNLHYWLDRDILLTHAGLHPGWLREASRAAAAEILDEAADCLLKGRWHPLLSWGQDRGNLSAAPRVGGVTWMDWSNLKPLAFCHQVVGHTPGTHPRHKTFHGMMNLCIDIGNASACATIETEIFDGTQKRMLRVWRREGNAIQRALEAELIPAKSRAA